MKSNTNRILGILRIFFYIYTVLLSIVMLIAIIIFVTSIVGVEIESLKNIKIETTMFHGTIANLQSLGKVRLFYVILSFLILGTLQFILFISVIRVISRIKISHPFSLEIYQLISRISKVAFAIGIISFILTFIYGLMNQEVQISIDTKSTEIQFFLLSAVVFVIGEIYNRGVELQSENDLTI